MHPSTTTAPTRTSTTGPAGRRAARRVGPVAAGLAAVLTLAACSSAEAETEETVAAGATEISAERCAANEAAGTITYITGYQYQSSAGILEAVAADALGYFDALCLDVEIQPGSGDTAANAQLVAAGTAQVTSLGNEAEVLKAVAGGVDITGVLTWAHVPIATLMTGPEITDLTQLEGQTLGHKGSLPAPLRAMLVAEGVDVDAIELVEVGYDPSVLPRGQVQALTGYKSNEPLTLEAMGEDVTVWNPEDVDVVGSFGALAVNPDFAAEHPQAVTDYLRAVIHAFDHCVENGEECVGYAAELAESGYDAEHNAKIWATEAELALSSTPDGEPLGYLDAAATEAEAQTLVDSGELGDVPAVEDAFDASFLEAVYDGTELVWPGE
ncbi:ABC transporter substrate-binding protein [Cellulomonas oligotrophica]|uniref:NitT/TauT family transport system substrate-binding protein n=1 Tax=Cellulomonas oligotrophica TaxID=931536 RepID=A0A7Y9FF99_9CELL|nr:ABC transporter substrate-binding protein [Cellulomonas oligotrophica]NYD86083.1 NitT/TauT family transport system substrate-binding protein [Cellulomonas oligotrophica]GIG30910.1 nitrate ABC transporter substrate-binding protein [Cellulomonas oligotrophica]